MSHWRELFVHRPEFRIIICKKCEHAVVPNQVERHVKDHHPFTTKQQRANIVESIKGLSDIAYRHEDVIYPTAEEPVIAGLPVFKDGLQCRECKYVCRRVQGMQEHCKKHGWVNNQRRGGRAKKKATHSSNRIWDVGIACQRFFEYRQWQRLFVVQAETEQSTAASQHAGLEAANRILASINTARAAKRNERRIEGGSRRCVANPWLDFVGWHRHLGGFQVKELTQLVWPAKGEAEFDESIHEAQDSVYGEESEAELARACQATKRMIRSAFATSTVECVGRAALESVNRRETGASNNEKPFYGKLKVQSLRKYMQVWVKVLRYIWRSADRKDMPVYRLTDTQRMRLERLRTACQKRGDECRREAVERQEAAEKASVVFWVSMFDHELHDNEFDSGIVSALAVLGLDEQGNWKAAFNYTQVLSAVITTMRAVVVHRAWLNRQQMIQRAVDDGQTEEEAREMAPSVVSGVDALTQRFMTLREFGGRISPMDRLYHQRTYGMRIRFSTKAEGRASWQGEQLCIDNVSFSMDDIRSVVHGLVETVQHSLARDLVFTEPGIDKWRPDEMPALDMERLFDNPAQLDAGWSFLQDARNNWAEDGSDWMLVRMFQDAAIKKRFVKHSNDEVLALEDVTWNETGIERYFRAVRRWKEQLIVLVHLSAGAPARATELLSIQHKNGAEARAQRGIFIENQMMAFVTMYHKGYSASGKFKVVHRFVPDEVAELVACYLWLVQPFIEHLQYVTGRQVEEPTSFLWEPEEEEGWGVGEDEEMDEELNGEEPSTDEGDEEGYRAPQQESTSKNVDGYWDTNRVRRVMCRETEKRIGVKIGVAMWRQAYPAIQRQYSMDSNVKDTIGQLYEQAVTPTSGAQSIEEVRSKQAGHVLDIEEMIYGLLLNENPFTTMHEREQFRQVSMDWHRMLHFRSAWRQDSRMPKQVKQQVGNAREEARRWRFKQMRSVDIDAQLKRVTQNEQAEFRGVQREGLQAIVGGMPRVTIVMRTGGGKSLFFMIPAAGSKDGVTIVVVPVVSLRQDLVDRCEKVGLSVAAWDGSRPPYHARIVFITPESAVTLGFGRFIDEKRASHQLERIVIDECHTMLEASAEWRPKMLRLGEMAQKDVQTVYLTATLPPSEEEAWLSIAGVAKRDMHIIRDVTTRPNVAYSVIKYDVEEEEQCVKALVEEKLKQYADGQVVVYCRTIDAVKRVAEYTGGQAFYRAIGTSEEKARILRQLTSEHSRLFAATNALGLGVDAPRIRCVIHVGCPLKMKQYAQESGRAGRDGKESEAIIMRGVRSDGRGEKVVGEWKMERTMLQFVEGAGCRRVTYDRHMDGRTDRSGCEKGEAQCDACQSSAWGRRKQRRIETVARDEVGAVAGVEGEEAGLGLPEDWDGETIVEGESELGSVDGGTEDRWEQERSEMEALAAQTQAIQQRARMQTVQRHLQVEQFEELLQRWQGHCSICMAIGEEGRGHEEWRKCPRREYVARVEECWKDIGRVRYNYSACFSCHAPQAICHSWQAMGGGKSGRFRRNHGVRCQFGTVVRDIGATIWAVGRDGVLREWVREQLQAGLVRPDEDKENRGVESTIEWFGRKFVEGGVEVSGMCRMIWKFGHIE